LERLLKEYPENYVFTAAELEKEGVPLMAASLILKNELTGLPVYFFANFGILSVDKSGNRFVIVKRSNYGL